MEIRLEPHEYSAGSSYSLIARLRQEAHPCESVAEPPNGACRLCSPALSPELDYDRLTPDYAMVRETLHGRLQKGLRPLRKPHAIRHLNGYLARRLLFTRMNF